MRKGDESKKRIIDAAERLFDQKGYASTSVQDILDALGISKGAFYHYFETKMDLLTAVCSRRSGEWYAQGVEYVRGMRAGAVEKLNAALKLMNMLDREAPAVLGSLTELGIAGQDASARRELREISIDIIAPLIEEILAEGMRSKQFTVKRPGEVARLITMMALDINEETARSIARDFRDPDCAPGVLELLNAYRESIEVIINAPFGSIEIYDMGDMISAIGRVVVGLDNRR